MRVLGTCLFVLFFSVFAEGQDQTKWHECWKREGLKRAAIGVSVKNTRNGQTVYERNPDMSLCPASVVKLLPTIFSLKREGNSFTYKTEVFYTGEIRDGVLYGDIRVRAGGDPTLDSKYFPDARFVERIVFAIVDLGIRRVEGRIIVLQGDHIPVIPGSWLWEDVANYYAALYHGFNYRDNAYTLHLASGKVGSLTRLVSVTPEVPRVKFRNEVTASVENRDNAWIFGGPESSILVVRGTIPANRTSFFVRGAMYDPAEVFGLELENRLKGKGIQVEKRVRDDVAVHGVFTITSPKLEDIVFHTNKSSVNMFAEALGGVVSTFDFEGTVKRELKGLGIDSTGIMLKDACGLSSLDALPAETFTDLLLWANRHLGESFLASLPVGGVDRGLRVYSDDISLGGNLRAKTGSFSGVRALAGYLVTQKGETLAFTILINHYTGDSLFVQQAIRDFLKMLAEQE